MSALVHLRGIPRRPRFLAVAFVCFCLILLLPKLDPGLLGPSLFSPGPVKPKFDVLQYVDPLIGTTNGGKPQLTLPSSHPPNPFTPFHPFHAFHPSHPPTH